MNTLQFHNPEVQPANLLERFIEMKSKPLGVLASNGKVVTLEETKHSRSSLVAWKRELLKYIETPHAVGNPELGIGFEFFVYVGLSYRFPSLDVLPTYAPWDFTLHKSKFPSADLIIGTVEESFIHPQAFVRTAFRQGEEDKVIHPLVDAPVISLTAGEVIGYRNEVGKTTLIEFAATKFQATPAISTVFGQLGRLYREKLMGDYSR